jgi:hypothetical protein
MLIGVMRHPLTKAVGSFTADYQFRVLLRGDLLLRTGLRSSLQSTLNTLITFREEWHQSEGLLVSLIG